MTKKETTLKIMKVSRWFKLALIFFLMTLFAGARIAQAQNQVSPEEQAFYEHVQQWRQDTEGDLGLERFGAENMTNFALTLSEAIAPIQDPNNPNLQNNNGLLGGLGNMIIAMYETPPANTKLYLADLGQSFGVKPAYAQSQTGFNALSNLLPLWKATRNAAYIVLIFVFIATGIAIMLRLKIDPKTAVTIQNSIPRLVAALILITFSYAIVGLLIDLINVIIYLGIAIFSPDIVPASELLDKQRHFTSLGFGDAYGILMGKGVNALAKVVTSIFSLSFSGIIGGILSTLVSVVFYLIFAFVALYLVGKLFFNLLKAYISIILAVIIGPIQILLGAFPGNAGGFGQWFQNLLANVLVFPAVALFLFIAGVIIDSGQGPTWTPPVLGFTGSNVFIGVIGLGLLLAAGNIPTIVQEALGFKGLGGFGSAIGQSLKFGYSAAGWGYDRTIGPTLDYRSKLKQEATITALKGDEEAAERLKAAAERHKVAGKVGSFIGTLLGRR